MIVHLVASTQRIKDNIGDLRHMIDIIHSQGHELAVDWVEPAYARWREGPQNIDTGWRTIYKENMIAIEKCDAIIAEATLSSFGTGYQIAIGVRLKKPTLILRRDDINNDIMAVGVDEEDIRFDTYNEASLENKMTTFLKENEISTKDLRFNFSIDRKIYNYLRWASSRSGATKAEVVRQLIDREIERNSAL